jgi:hypothetical protein
MSLLTIIQGVALRCNYAQPSSAFGSVDPVIQQMIACAQDTGDEMVERVDWQALKISTPVTFTGNGTQTLFPLPTGFMTNINKLSPDCFVSSAYPTLRMVGPVMEDDLLRMKALPMSLYPSVWRVVDNNIEFFPALQSGEVVSYVYQQGQWITNSVGVPYSPPLWAADTDLVVFSERLVRLGTIYKWKMLKGLDYAEDMRAFENSLDRLSAQEATGRIIDMSESVVLWDDTWPGTITDNTDQNY